MPYSSSATVLISASREAIWCALTEPALVKQYFFGTNLETTWAVGSPIFFRGAWEGKAYEDRGTVLTFEPLRALSYNYWSSFSGHDDTVELRQVIRFELAEASSGVRVDVEQSNVDTEERAEHSAKNWRAVLEALQAFVEKRT